jgi:hypothetical protein
LVFPSYQERAAHVIQLQSGAQLGSFVQTQCFLPRTGALMHVTRDREAAVLDPASCKILRQFPALDAGDVDERITTREAV